MRVLHWAGRRAADSTVRRAEPVGLGHGLELASDGIWFEDPRAAASDQTAWLMAFQAALEQGCAVSDQALTLIEQNLDRYAAEDFTATDAQRQIVFGLFTPRIGLYARLSEMHDCGLLGRMFPEFQPHPLPRDSRLLPQVHRRRAHAADAAESRVAARPADVRAAAGSAACCTSCTRRSCCRSRCCSTTSASGATTTMRSRARGWRSRCSTGWASPAKTAGPSSSSSSITSRCRGSPSGAIPRIPPSHGSSRSSSAPRSG